MPAAENFFWDGYLHWARALENVHHAQITPTHDASGTAGRTPYEPIFIRMKKSLTARKLEELDKAFRKQGVTAARSLAPNGFLDDVIIDPTEFAIALSQTLLTGTPLAFFIYRKIALTNGQHDPGNLPFDILDVGVPTLAHSTGATVSGDVQAESGAKPVIGAVIDNDIGFLNRRFRGLDGNSRFQAIWLQSRERVGKPGGMAAASGGVSYAHIGRVLIKSEIDAMIADETRTERSQYSDINIDLHENDRFQVSPPIASHGTAVADAAFGASENPDDDMALVPLLGVQLPPEAAMDTSGTYSESYIVQGVRWLCHQARQINPAWPLVINLSYGVLAGPKDGGKFIEAMIDHEIDVARKLGQQVTVVVAYGNSLNTRQVARLSLAPGASETIEWVVQPDNPQPSFMEVRRVLVDQLGTIPAALECSVLSPGGRSMINVTPGQNAAVPPLTVVGDMPACRLYHVPARFGRPSFLNLAVAPTRAVTETFEKAEAGTWQLTLQNNSRSETLDLVLQIQRGDVAPGFRMGGRQARFEGQLTETRDASGYPILTVTAPLTNEGTNSAYSTSLDRRVVTAGALRRVLGNDLPADYSAIGAPWSGGPSPDAQHVVDGIWQRGVLVSGTYSGTTSRLSGSSAAAALETRRQVQAVI